MRPTLLLSLICVLAGCASSKPLTPREYLDEQTAATITVAADPVIFVADHGSPELRAANRDLHIANERNRDYLELYGVDVNRMGTHRQYIALMKWMTPQSVDVAPVLVLSSGTQTIELQATTADARTLGMAAPPAASYSNTAKWWYFPTDAATLKKIAGAGELRATLNFSGGEIAYTVFSDGRAQLAELTAILPQ